jgi:hypothetical protein
LLQRLRSDIDLTVLLPNYQFGFRTGHSTFHQAHRIIHEIAKSLEEKRLCTAVFLDVAQAFDSLAYRIVIQTQDHPPQLVLSALEVLSPLTLLPNKV